MKIFEEVVKKIPWMKASAPMIPIFFIDLLLSGFMIKLHSLNLTHGIKDGFPNIKAFNIFLYANLFSMFVYLSLSAIAQISQGKIDKVRTESGVYHYK